MIPLRGPRSGKEITVTDDEKTVSVICRYFASCQYTVCGPEEFVISNYRQHLKEDHRIKHPRVEPEEIHQDAALLEQSSRAAVK